MQLIAHINKLSVFDSLSLSWFFSNRKTTQSTIKQRSTDIKSLIDIDTMSFNESEIRLLKILYTACKEDVKWGVYSYKLKSVNADIINTLIDQKIIGYAQGVLSLTIFGYNYCVNKL